MRINRIIPVLAILGVLGFMVVLFYPLSQQVYMPLHGKYYIWTTEGGEALKISGKWYAYHGHADIDFPERIGPHVDGYHVFPDLITGHVSEPRKPLHGSRTPDERETPGYFIIDSKAPARYVGLSKQDWLDKLREFGINEEPRLFEPSRFDKWLGRNKPQ